MYIFDSKSSLYKNCHGWFRTPCVLSAAPVHQLQEYYMYGKVDDCLGHWSTFYDCLKKRTKFADQV